MVSLSDHFVVAVSCDPLREIICDVDLIFGNKDETMVFTVMDPLEAAAEDFR